MSTLQSLLNEIHESLDEAKKSSLESLEDCKKEISKNYSTKIIEAIKIANARGDDTNPVYQGKIEKFKGISILHLAAYGFWGDETCEILSYIRPEDIKRGSGLKIESELMIAVEEKNGSVREWLLENDPDVMYQKASGSSALHIACMVNDYDTTERLIERVTREKGIGAAKEFVNAQNKYGCTPLYDALILHSDRVYTLDSQKMLKFLDLFIENGVDLGKEILGEYTGKYIIFNHIIACPQLQNFNLVTAVVKMLNSGQDIKIDFSKTNVYKFFTNQSNIDKILSLEDYDAHQKSIALNKIKEALINHQEHAIETDKLVDNTIHNIDEHISHLVTLGEPSVDLGEAESGVEHLDIADDHHDTQLSGNSHEEGITEG